MSFKLQAPFVHHQFDQFHFLCWKGTGNHFYFCSRLLQADYQTRLEKRKQLLCFKQKARFFIVNIISVVEKRGSWKRIYFLSMYAAIYRCSMSLLIWAQRNKHQLDTARISREHSQEKISFISILLCDHNIHIYNVWSIAYVIYSNYCKLE